MHVYVHVYTVYDTCTLYMYICIVSGGGRVTSSSSKTEMGTQIDGDEVRTVCSISHVDKYKYMCVKCSAGRVGVFLANTPLV